MDIIPGVDAADINHFFHEVKILEGGVDVTASFLDLFWCVTRFYSDGVFDVGIGIE